MCPQNALHDNDDDDDDDDDGIKGLDTRATAAVRTLPECFSRDSFCHTMAL
jgi:hypothetical protein